MSSPPQQSPSTRNLSDQQDSQLKQDCLGCRVLGGVFAVGGGGYLGSLLLMEPPPKGAHRASILITAFAVFSTGMFRAFF